MWSKENGPCNEADPARNAQIRLKTIRRLLMRTRSVFYSILLVGVLCLGLLAVATAQYRESGATAMWRFQQTSTGMGDLPQPTPANGTGVLGSSMYSGGPPRGTRSGGGGGGGGQVSNATSFQPTMTQTRVYNPMDTMALTASPTTSALVVYRQQLESNQLETATNALAQSADQQAVVTRPTITSLAPAQQSEYREAMLRGEAALRAGDFADALANFQTAETESNGLEEPLLAQVLAQLGMADGSYAETAEALGRTLHVFPALPMARVHPRNFYADNQYDQLLSTLRDFVTDAPTDAYAQFVLAYLEWCDGNVPAAGAAAQAAVDNATEPALQQSIDLLIEGAGMARDHLTAVAPDMQDTMELPWAGLRLRLPVGFTPARLRQINRILEANGGTPEAPQRISLNVYPIAESIALPDVLESIANNVDAQRGIDLLSVDTEATVPFLDGEGCYRAFRCRYGDTTFAVLRFCFAREVTDFNGQSQRLAYVLTMGTRDSQADLLLPTVAAVARSIELTAVQRPIDLPIPSTGQEVVDQQWGVSIRQPDGWAGSLDERGFTMGQFDCLLGGTITPRVELVMAIVDDDHSPQSIIEAAIEAREAEGYTMTVLAQGPAELAGEDGYQFVTEKTSPDGNDTWIEIGRAITVTESDETKRLIGLVVRCEYATQEQAEAIMDALAPTVSLRD
jgi:tetratricopeptide (TPR) repeat protein